MGAGYEILTCSVAYSNEHDVTAPFMVPCYVGNHERKYFCLPDTGDSAGNFVRKDIAQQICDSEGISPVQLTHPKAIRGYDSTTCQLIKWAILPKLRVEEHTVPQVPLYIVNNCAHDIILGWGWMKQHGAFADPITQTLKFVKGVCTHLGANYDIDTEETGWKMVADDYTGPPPPRKLLRRLSSPEFREKPVVKTDCEPTLDCRTISGEHHRTRIKQRSMSGTRLTSYVDDANLSQGHRNSLPTTKKEFDQEQIEKRKMVLVENTCFMIGAAPFRALTKQAGAQVFTMRIGDTMAINIEDVKAEQEKRKKQVTNPRDKAPEYLHDDIDAFSKDKADILPPHRGDNDYKIELEESAVPGYTPMYRMSDEELQICRDYIEEHLKKGFIAHSSSPYASPVLFVKKPGGGIRFCVDYRKLNAITKKDRYPLPLIQETLAQLTGAKIFSKLDIRHAFNRIRMATPRDEDLTTFRTRYGSFKYKVLPFGLCNGPAAFQHFINSTLGDYFDEFCSAYIDDVLIYSKSLEEHKKHVLLVVQALKKAGLPIDIDKCEFHVTRTKFLGLIVTTEGVEMDPDKVKAIDEWETPRSKTHVMAFAGLTNFYRRFIKNYSSICRPFTRLLRKGVEFDWDDDCKAAFKTLKEAVKTAPILAHFDPRKTIHLETDASDWVYGGVMSQYQDDGQLHPVAFYSKKMIPAECNYEIYDKELLAIVRCFEEWRAELQGAQSPVEVLTDHRSLQWFMTTKKLTRRQARWSEYLSDFNFKIAYRPGKENVVADALTRQGQEPLQADDERLQHQFRTVLSPAQFDTKALQDMGVCVMRQVCAPEFSWDTCCKSTPVLRMDSVTKIWTEERLAKYREGRSFYELDQELPHPEITDQEYLRWCEYITVCNMEDGSDGELPPPGVVEYLLEGQKDDEWISDIRQAFDRGDRTHNDIALGHLTVNQDDKLLRYKGKILVPKELYTKLIEEVHNQPAVGHPGAARLLVLLKRSYYWPRMDIEVKQFVRNCDVCRRAKASRQRYNGDLNPLEIPDLPWQHISMDFVVKLPKDKTTGDDCVFVVVDRLTKERHLIPCKGYESGTSAEETAMLLISNVFRLHGLWESAVSDRGSQFVAEVYQHLMRILQVRVKLSTAFHPETDGQTEIVNAEMERFIRTYVNYLQDDWVKWLPLAEFAGNTNVSATTQVSPFFANKGYHPRLSFDFQPKLKPDEVLTAAKMESRQQAYEMAKNLQDVWEFVKNQMSLAQTRMAGYADNSRRPLPRYNVGDKVYIHAKNIETQRECKKFDNVNIGPYPITRRIGASSYEVKLDPETQIHNVFHSSLLSLDPDDPLPGQKKQKGMPVIVDGEEEWEVENVQDSRLFHGRLQYRVNWKNNPPDRTWYEASYLDNAQEEVEAFHNAYPKKPSAKSAAEWVRKERVPRRK